MQHHTPRERGVVALVTAISLMLFFAPQASAMHIMEGYLPAGQCIVWGAVSLPFLALRLVAIRRTVQKQRKTLLLLAMSGAFIFVISSLKIPSVTGSCSHMTGTGLAAILFGPFHAAILGLIVLLFQAILLAHGGITTLGANTFSMAVAGPLFAWALYRLGCRLNMGRKGSIFLAAMMGDLLTYCVTSLQLALAYPSEQGGVAASMVKFLGVFAPRSCRWRSSRAFDRDGCDRLETYAQSELHEIGFLRGGTVI
jgi:cobalt/nickel transport system permease protein